MNLDFLLPHIAHVDNIFLPSLIRLVSSEQLLWLFYILKLSLSSQYFYPSLIIFLKSSWRISLFINASDILLSMLFNLLLASITNLLCFSSYFLLFFIGFFMIPVKIENEKLKLALHNSYRRSNNGCKWCSRNATSCYR